MGHVWKGRGFVRSKLCLNGSDARFGRARVPSPLPLPLFSLSQKALSQVLFLTPHLPAFFLRHRLRSHVLEIRHLDRAMLRLGLGQLSEEELKAVRTPPPGPAPPPSPSPALPIVSGAASGHRAFLQTLGGAERLGKSTREIFLTALKLRSLLLLFIFLK